MNTTQITAVFSSSSSIRIVMVDDEPWFVASDISDALGYRNAPDMTRNLDDDEKGTQIVRTLGGNQEMTVICESGLYAAILKSRKPEAKKFRKWVTSEVLPSIRKTGCYVAPSAQPETASERLLDDHEISKLKIAARGVVRYFALSSSAQVFSAIYREIKAPLRIGSIDQLPASELDGRLDWLKSLEVRAREHHGALRQYELGVLRDMGISLSTDSERRA